MDFLPKISKHIQFQSVRIEIKSDDKVNVSVYLPLNSGMFFNKDTIKSTIVKNGEDYQQSTTTWPMLNLKICIQKMIS